MLSKFLSNTGLAAALFFTAAAHAELTSPQKATLATAMASGAPLAILWENNDFTGRAVTISDCLDINSLSKINNFNDRTTSIQLFNGAEITIYQHDNWQGSNRVITQNVNTLNNGPYYFNDEASSVKFNNCYQP